MLHEIYLRELNCVLENGKVFRTTAVCARCCVFHIYGVNGRFYVYPDPVQGLKMNFFGFIKSISEKDLKDGIIYKKFDLISCKFSGCALLMLDDKTLTLSSIDIQGTEKFESLSRDESGKSILEIFREEARKSKSNPSEKQRHIRKSNRKRRPITQIEKRK